MGAGKTIATKVPLNIHRELIELVENGSYLSISDFLREAIREQLKLYKISKIKVSDYKEAKIEILSYFNKFKECYSDEIAIDLGYDYDLVFTVLTQLRNENRIELVSDKIDNEDKNKNYLFVSGKRLLVESRDKSDDFIRIKENDNYFSSKKKGFILNEGLAIVSKRYKLIK